ncbi:MAG TPA: toxin [Pseudonocardiaceae bacterium]|nr:toxin [Pseudonocardiaceae bacterium]
MRRGRIRRGTDFAELRDRCQRRIDALDLTGPINVGILAGRLADRRGRPLHLLGISQRGPGPTGLWVATDQGDYVFYTDLATGLHRCHIILHEIGHIALAHRASATLTADTARLLAPNLDPNVVRRSLSRTNYSAVEEQEAEMFASLVMPMLDAPPGAVVPSPEDPVGETLRRFAIAFGFDEGTDV